jgi:uncharacterized protein
MTPRPPTATARLILPTGLLTLLVVAGVARAGPVPPKPERYVTDASGVLPPARLEALNERLAAFERETTAQVLVWIAPHVPEGTTPEELGADAIRSWGVGQKGKDNGVVLFVFTADRKVRIATGYGMEGPIPDAVAKRILADVVKPHLKRGDFAAGVEAGVDALLRAARDEGGSSSPVATAPAAPLAGVEEPVGWAEPPPADREERVFWILAAAYALAVVALWVWAIRRRTEWPWRIAILSALPVFPAMIAAIFVLVMVELYRRKRGLPTLFPASSRGGSGDWSSSGSYDSSSSWSSDSSSSSSSDFSSGGGDSGGGGASDSF